MAGPSAARKGESSDTLRLSADQAEAAAPVRVDTDITENTSGIVPLEFKCLVRPSVVEVDPAIMRAKKAGLAIPQDVLDRELMAQIVARFVAAGGNAFEDWRDKALPKLNDRVLIAKFAGVTVQGADGVEYRMLNDKDISGIITKEGVGRL